MYRLDTRFHDTSAPSAAFLEAALAQAVRDADDVLAATAQVPWSFVPASPEAKALLDADAGCNRSWTIVTCTRSDDAGHTQERCLTAIQRYLLSLAAEGIDATWVGNGLPPGLVSAARVRASENVLGVVHMDPA